MPATTQPTRASVLTDTGWQSNAFRTITLGCRNQLMWVVVDAGRARAEVWTPTGWQIAWESREEVVTDAALAGWLQAPLRLLRYLATRHVPLATQMVAGCPVFGDTGWFHGPHGNYARILLLAARTGVVCRVEANTTSEHLVHLLDLERGLWGVHTPDALVLDNHLVNTFHDLPSSPATDTVAEKWLADSIGYLSPAPRRALVGPTADTGTAPGEPKRSRVVDLWVQIDRGARCLTIMDEQGHVERGRWKRAGGDEWPGALLEMMKRHRNTTPALIQGWLPHAADRDLLAARIATNSGCSIAARTARDDQGVVPAWIRPLAAAAEQDDTSDSRPSGPAAAKRPPVEDFPAVPHVRVLSDSGWARRGRKVVLTCGDQVMKVKVSSHASAALWDGRRWRTVVRVEPAQQNGRWLARWLASGPLPLLRTAAHPAGFRRAPGVPADVEPQHTPEPVDTTVPEALCCHVWLDPAKRQFLVSVPGRRPVKGVWLRGLTPALRATIESACPERPEVLFCDTPGAAALLHGAVLAGVADTVRVGRPDWVDRRRVPTWAPWSSDDFATLRVWTDASQYPSHPENGVSAWLCDDGSWDVRYSTDGASVKMLELRAILDAWHHVGPLNRPVVIFTDSQNARWMIRYGRVDEPFSKANRARLRSLRDAILDGRARIEWVRGHEDDIGNIAVDRLARTCLHHGNPAEPVAAHLGLYARIVTTFRDDLHAPEVDDPAFREALLRTAREASRP